MGSFSTARTSPLFLGLALAAAGSVPVLHGRPEGAFLVRDIDATFAAADSSPGPFLEAGGAVYFASTGGTGSGLWRTDGTPEGTALVKAVALRELTSIGGTLFFASGFSPFSARFGDKLWKSDGSAQGTAVVSDQIGPETVQYKGIRQFTAGDTGVFFVRNLDQTYSIWRGDETGASLVANTWSWSPAGLVAVGDTLFYSIFRPDTGTGAELWEADASGARLVADINPGPASSSPSGLVRVGDTLFFAAFRPDLGTELWKSDGTPEGTVLVKDVNPGSGASGPANLTGVDGTLFFTAFRPETGHELWRSDGQPPAPPSSGTSWPARAPPRPPRSPPSAARPFSGPSPPIRGSSCGEPTGPRTARCW